MLGVFCPSFLLCPHTAHCTALFAVAPPHSAIKGMCASNAAPADHLQKKEIGHRTFGFDCGDGYRRKNHAQSIKMSGANHDIRRQVCCEGIVCSKLKVAPVQCANGGAITGTFPHCHCDCVGTGYSGDTCDTGLSGISCCHPLARPHPPDAPYNHVHARLHIGRSVYLLLCVCLFALRAAVSGMCAGNAAADSNLQKQTGSTFGFECGVGSSLKLGAQDIPLSGDDDAAMKRACCHGSFGHAPPSPIRSLGTSHVRAYGGVISRVLSL